MIRYGPKNEKQPKTILIKPLLAVLVQKYFLEGTVNCGSATCINFKNSRLSTDDMGCISIARKLPTAETSSLYIGLKVGNGWDHAIVD